MIRLKLLKTKLTREKKKNVVFLFTLKVGQVSQILSLILHYTAANIWPLHSGTLFKNLVKDTDMKSFSHKN